MLVALWRTAGERALEQFAQRGRGSEMPKIMYAHQSDQLAERSVDQFCQTLALGNVTQVRVKVTQWLTWTGHFDTGPAWQINDLDSLQATHAQFQQRGVELVPWGVPMGLDANGDTAVDAAGVEAEAQRFAAIARACGKIELDVEPYADFWPAVAQGDYRAVVPLFRRLRELAPDAQITMDCPYRQSPSTEDQRLSPVIASVSPFVDAFYLQSYFGVAQGKDAEQRARNHTDKPVYHIAAADPSQFGDMLDWLSSVKVENVGVWVAPRMNAALYAALALHDFGSGLAPQAKIQWQAPGFASMFQQRGSEMGDPLDLPYADNFGNVFQDSASGTAVWMKAYNTTFWLPKPAGIGPVMPPSQVVQPGFPPTAAIAPGAAATGATGATSATGAMGATGT
jgi:hypothetical protein